MQIRRLLTKIRLRGGMEIKKIFRRPFAHYLNPFLGDSRPVIIHCCYHKVGTIWFGRVLREIAAHFGLSFAQGSNYTTIRNFETKQHVDVFLDLGSHVDLELLGNYVGSHMIRDPRDLIVSGYFYHLWTNELWANLPRAEYRGMSYKEYLNSLSQSDGLAAEMQQASFFWVKHMLEWNFENSKIFEIRYEDIRTHETGVFRQMFEQYGFSDKAVHQSYA